MSGLAWLVQPPPGTTAAIGRVIKFDVCEVDRTELHFHSMCSINNEVPIAEAIARARYATLQTLRSSAEWRTLREIAFAAMVQDAKRGFCTKIDITEHWLSGFLRKSQCAERRRTENKRDFLYRGVQNGNTKADNSSQTGSTHYIAIACDIDG